jgi:hypothetical protein
LGFWFLVSGTKPERGLKQKDCLSKTVAVVTGFSTQNSKLKTQN